MGGSPPVPKPAILSTGEGRGGGGGEAVDRRGWMRADGDGGGGGGGGVGQVGRAEGECFLLRRRRPPAAPRSRAEVQPAPSELKRLPHAAPPQCRRPQRGRSQRRRQPCRPRRGGPCAAPRPELCVPVSPSPFPSPPPFIRPFAPLPALPPPHPAKQGEGARRDGSPRIPRRLGRCRRISE